MLNYVTTSILESDTQTVVNTVNTVGVMGKGLAAEFKKRYPRMFRRYRELCKTGRFEVGQLWLWKGEGQWVLNFPTKKHWRQPSRLSYLEAGLQKFQDQYESRGIYEISFPRLGCGNGELDWAEVRPLMERYLSRLPIRVYIHDYMKDIGLSEHREAKSDGAPLQSFDELIDELRIMITERDGEFHTVSNGKPFQATLKEDKSLVLRRGGNGAEKSTSIHVDELFEVWNMLLRGPVTRQTLSGSAHTEANYLLSLLSTLPRIRPLGVRSRNDAPKTAVELVESGRAPEVLTPQSAFQWA